jgi:hypothetical protein
MLNLPTDPRAAAFKAVRSRLRNDPVLSSVGIRFFNKHPDKPTLDSLPYMVIGMKAGPIGVTTPTANDATIVIGVDYVVSAAGTDEDTAWEDLANLYGQIEKAINQFGEITWLSDPVKAVNTTVSVRGVPRFTQQGFTTIPMGDVNAIGGSCTFSITLRINTCRGSS